MPILDPQKRKEYMTKYHREVWYPKNKERRVELMNHNRLRVKKLLQDYKLQTGCKDCGYNKHVEALEFDHLSNKEFNLSSSIGRGMGWERIQKEIDKCELVCANCHRVRTANRR